MVISEPGDRKTISIMKACALAGVGRRTIYNWLSSGKLDYTCTAGGSVRICVDTIFSSTPRTSAREPYTP